MKLLDRLGDVHLHVSDIRVSVCLCIIHVSYMYHTCIHVCYDTTDILHCPDVYTCNGSLWKVDLICIPKWAITTGMINCIDRLRDIPKIFIRDI